MKVVHRQWVVDPSRMCILAGHVIGIHASKLYHPGVQGYIRVADTTLDLLDAHNHAFLQRKIETLMTYARERERDRERNAKRAREELQASATSSDEEMVEV